MIRRFFIEGRLSPLPHSNAPYLARVARASGTDDLEPLNNRRPEREAPRQRSLGYATVYGDINRGKTILEERRAHMGSETAKVSHALDMLKFECWYYEQAIQDGNENRLRALIPDDLPEEIKDAYKNARAR